MLKQTLKQTLTNDTEKLKEKIIETLKTDTKLEYIDPNQLLVIIEFSLEKMKELNELEYLTFIDKRMKENKEKRDGLKP